MHPITPHTYRPFYPATTLPEDRPAFVREHPDARVVEVWHADGPLHENVRATVDRYRTRGWDVQVLDLLTTRKAA